MKCCKILRSLDRVFVVEFVKCLCIGAPSKDPARFVDLGFWLFKKQEALEYKRVPKKQTTTDVRSAIEINTSLADLFSSMLIYNKYEVVAILRSDVPAEAVASPLQNVNHLQAIHMDQTHDCAF